MKLNLRCSVALFVCLLTAVPAKAQQQGWSPTGSLGEVRAYGHTATLLVNGQVLVVGGSVFLGVNTPPYWRGVGSAEVYDPVSGKWSPTAGLSSPSGGHIAVRLNNGKVLVAGGNNGYFKLVPITEIYDPDAGAWVATGRLKEPRTGATATLLVDGRVLVTGGAINQFVRLNSAELYDPATGAWTIAAPMSARRFGHTATLLTDGRVLVVGGSYDSNPRTAEIYDPVNGSWRATGSLANDRVGHTATLLANGKVLVAGGGINGDDDCNGVNNAELYDPATGRWSATGRPVAPRRDYPGILLSNGSVLVVGGARPGCLALDSSETYEAATGSWSIANTLTTPRYGHSVTLLTNGQVLAVGGSDDNSAEIYDSGTPAAISVLAASLSAGGALAPESIALATGTNLATATESASSVPLPTQLAGTTVNVRDRVGAERLAPLFSVSPAQIKYQVPLGTASGTATVTVTAGDGIVAAGLVEIADVAPGLFSANSNGQGVAAGSVFRRTAGGAERFEPISRFDSGQNRFVAEPIDLSPESDQVFLTLFGTGIRFRSSLSAVKATIGGAPSEVLFAGPEESFAGLDQVNMRLPRSITGRGDVEVLLLVDGKAANTVRVNIR